MLHSQGELSCMQESILLAWSGQEKINACGECDLVHVIRQKRKKIDERASSRCSSFLSSPLTALSHLSLLERCALESSSSFTLQHNAHLVSPLHAFYFFLPSAHYSKCCSLAQKSIENVLTFFSFATARDHLLETPEVAASDLFEHTCPQNRIPCTPFIGGGAWLFWLLYLHCIFLSSCLLYYCYSTENPASFISVDLLFTSTLLFSLHSLRCNGFFIEINMNTSSFSLSLTFSLPLFLSLSRTHIE